MAPAKPAKTTGKSDKSWASIRSHTDTNTATTVINEAKIRRKVICFFAPPESPNASTMSDEAVCPEIEATE